MAEAADAREAVYLIPVARVRESVQALLSRDTHPYFIAYLHLLRTATRSGRSDNLAPDWAELGRRLEVAGRPSEKPYLRPFWMRARESGQEWLNRNLAGSFAASSLRGVPQQVVAADGGKFTLRSGHAGLALRYLLLGVRMPVLALAGFLYRDYGILEPEEQATESLIRIFRTEHGFSDRSADFDQLFDVKWRGAGGPWLEPTTESAAGTSS